MPRKTTGADGKPIVNKTIEGMAELAPRKKGTGRPKKYDEDAILAALIEYTSNTTYPILTEFTTQNGLVRQYLYEMAEHNKELSDAIKSLNEKKQLYLEKGLLSGQLVPTGAIFVLKAQCGWRDRPEDTAEKSEKVVIVDDFK